jgi:hypothetical protein
LAHGECHAARVWRARQLSTNLVNNQRQPPTGSAQAIPLVACAEPEPAGAISMTHPSRTLIRTTWPGDHDVASWSRTASRASHPSSQLPDQPWLWSIASGLASSTPPWSGDEDDDADPTAAKGTILLATSAYQVWHVAWPVGSPIELSDTLDVQSFCVVEGALRLIDRAAPNSPGRRYEPGSGTVLTTPRALLIADERRTSAVHVILHGGAAGTESPPWNTRETRTSAAA